MYKHSAIVTITSNVHYTIIEVTLMKSLMTLSKSALLGRINCGDKILNRGPSGSTLEI